MSLGPSIDDVHEDLLASNEVAEPGAYVYERDRSDGRLYAVGPFGRARVGITLEYIPARSDASS